MRRLSISTVRFLALALALLPVHAAHAITLLEPIGSCTSASGPGALFQYMGCVYPWMIGVGGGITVVWGIWGGLQIATAGSAAGLEKGKEHLTAAIIGLLVMIFAGVILNAINPMFFKI
jgi:hypothetical protein